MRDPDDQQTWEEWWQGLLAGLGFPFPDLLAGERMLYCVFCTVPVGGDGLWASLASCPWCMGCEMKMQGYRFIVPPVLRSQANLPRPT